MTHSSLFQLSVGLEKVIRSYPLQVGDRHGTEGIVKQIWENYSLAYFTSIFTLWIWHQHVKKAILRNAEHSRNTTNEKLTHLLPTNHWTWSLNSGRVHPRNMSLGKQGNKWWQADSNFREVWFLALLVSKTEMTRSATPGNTLWARESYNHISLTAHNLILIQSKRMCNNKILTLQLLF